MGFTPTTGNAIAIGRIWSSFDTAADGFGAGAGRQYPPTVAQKPAGGIALRGTLGAERSRATVVGTGATATNITSGQIRLAADFWNLDTPDTYPT